MCGFSDKLILKTYVFESDLQNQCSCTGTTDYYCVREKDLKVLTIVWC